MTQPPHSIPSFFFFLLVMILRSLVFTEPYALKAKEEKIRETVDVLAGINTEKESKNERQIAWRVGDIEILEQTRTKTIKINEDIN